MPICMSLKIQNVCTSGRRSGCCLCSSADVSTIPSCSLYYLSSLPPLLPAQWTQRWFFPRRPKDTCTAGKSVLFEWLVLIEVSSSVNESSDTQFPLAGVWEWSWNHVHFGSSAPETMSFRFVSIIKLMCGLICSLMECWG